MVLFLAVFFYLGRLVGEQPAAEQGLQGDYFAYAAVGIAVLRVAQMSLSSFTRKIREEQTTGTFEALLAAPVRPEVIALASSAYDLLRAATSGLLVVVLAALLFGLELHTDAAGLAAALAALLGLLLLFAGLCVALGAFVVALQRATALLGIALAALALLGGVYFPTEVLPQPLEGIAEALPFTWGVDVIRDGLLGGEASLAQLGGLYGAGFALLPAALAGFAAATNSARRKGTLATY
jgi:ABC-2 type transport system permease protein